MSVQKVLRIATKEGTCSRQVNTGGKVIRNGKKMGVTPPGSSTSRKPHQEWTEGKQGM